MAEQDFMIRQITNKKGKTFWETIYSCTSMKSAMLLLMILTGAAMLGTVISPRQYDVYQSAGFRLLLTLVCGSTLLCSMRQFMVLCRSGMWRELARWGTFTVHAAVVLIALGALYGNVYGFSEEINLLVGKGYEINREKYAGTNDPFQLYLEDFKTEYYADGSESDWISRIRIEKDGQGILTQEVKVNHPLIYQGVSIYQSSFGMAIQTQYLDVSGKVVQEASLAEGQGMTIEDQPDMMVLPVQYIKGATPLVMYIIYKDGQEYGWGAAPLNNARFISPKLGMVKFTAIQPFTGLLIKRDPGIPLVWLGFILLVLGFFASLYKKNSLILLHKER